MKMKEELKYPVMITLRQIRDAHPCEDVWGKVLSANCGSKANLDAELELASIIDSNGIDDCLWALQCKPEYQHIYRKFAVVCADEVSHLMTDDRSTTALDVAWSHSSGEATDEQLHAAWDAAWYASCDDVLDEALNAAQAAAHPDAWDAADVATQAAAWAAAKYADQYAAQDAAWYSSLDASKATAGDSAWDAALEYQSKVLRRALTTGEIYRKCQKS